MTKNGLRNGIVAGLALVLLFTGCGPRAQDRGTAGPSPSAEERVALRIVVFCADAAAGRAVLQALARAGYEHPANYVNSPPNRTFNIKWGGASPAAVEEIAAIVEALVQRPLERLHVFPEAEMDIFLTLPLGEGGLPGAGVER